jgi:hypothetical protein
MNASVETKVLEANQATAAQQFAGQFNDSILVDQGGQEVPAAIPFAGDLLYCEQGVGSDQRIGSWIQLKSLTMHYCINAVAPTLDAWYEIFIVLDRSPLLGASLVGNDGVLALETAAGVPSNKLMLAFQNLSETGKASRFKILARKKHRLSSALSSPQTVPAITTAAPSDTSRPLYATDGFYQKARSYPQYVRGSINLKLSHKINYGPDVSVQPSNQTLRVMAFQCNPAGISAPRCLLQYYTRVRYKDA